MRILIATAEPWGTYHSAPFTSRATGPAVFHLTPSLDVPSPAQLAGLDSVRTADVLVVNSLAPGSWPARAAQRAAELSIPVVFSHLSYLGPSAAPAVRLPLAAVTAASEQDAQDTAAHLGIHPGTVQIVGLPLLDFAPVWRPVPHRVVLVTTVSTDLVNPLALPCAAREAASAGWSVLVAAHPREDLSLWKGFAVSSASTLDTAATASVVLGHAGSIFPAVAALGVPLVTLADSFLDVEVPSSFSALGSRLPHYSGALAALEQARPAPPERIEFTTGPRGGATDRLLATWSAAARPLVRA